MDCVVAREALSARLDGEREPVPSARVDEHLRACPDCTAWYDRVAVQANQLRGLADAGLIGAVSPPADHRGSAVSALWQRVRPHLLAVAIVVIGVVQIGLAVGQAAGLHFGMVADHHGAASGAHLLNESTAWSAALGIATIVMAFRRRIAPGLACVLVIYCGFLTYYVVSDAMAGQVTPVRVLSHLPVALAALVSILAARTERPGDPSPGAVQDDSAGPRRRHLRAADDPAA